MTISSLCCFFQQIINYGNVNGAVGSEFRRYPSSVEAENVADEQPCVENISMESDDGIIAPNPGRMDMELLLKVDVGDCTLEREVW